MDKIAQYRDILENLIKEYAAIPSDDEIESQVIFDREHDHYLLSNVGWQDSTWICGPVLYFDIKNDKIHIQHNGTECQIADELIAKGVAKEDIIVGFLSPLQKKYSGFNLES
jgi:hypothetical protein